MDSGQQHGSQIPRMIWIIGTPIVFCVGIVGNIITIIVLIKKNRNKTSTTVFLTVLAITDLLVMTISLPRWWLIYMFGLDIRHLSNGMCKVHWFLTYFDSAVSIGILVAVTIERLISTVKPYKMKTFCTFKSAVIISGAIVTAMVLIYGHVLFGLGIFHKEIPSTPNRHTSNDSLTADQDLLTTITKQTLKDVSVQLVQKCWFQDLNYGKFYNGPFQIMNIMLYNIIPEIIFLIGGIIIVKKLTASGRRVQPEQMWQPRNQTSTNRADVHSKQVTVSLLLVNIVFFICTTPVFIFLVGRSVWVDAENGMTETQEIIWAIFNLMFYTNHAVNFILYFLSGSRFRKQVIELLCCRKHTTTGIASRSQVSSVTTA